MSPPRGHRAATGPGGREGNFPSLAGQVAAAALGRLLLNTARRFAYPFAPAIGRGLGVSLTAVSALIAVNQITSVSSLIFGPLADRRGYRVMFLAGMAALAAGMLAGGFFPGYWTVMGALFLAGLGKAMFDPSILAYVSERVAYDRRGMAIGVMEMSWAASSLIGIPVMGWLMGSFSWRAPFFALGAAAIAVFVLLWRMMPAIHTPEMAGRRPREGFPGNFRSLVRSRAAAGCLVFAFFFNGASDIFFVAYGAWLEADFGLGLVAVGMAATVIGLAELLGEGLTATLSDRFGLRQSMIAGACLTIAVYALLPLARGGGLSAALGAIFALFLAVEFTIVTGLSLFTEVLPEARATMMSGYFASASAGRMCGALAGGWIWSARADIGAIGALSAGACAAGLTALLFGLRALPLGRR